MTPLPPLQASTPAEGGDAGHVWTLLEAYRVRVAQNMNGEHVGMIVVPKGFSTDFASVPRRFWRILPPFGEYLIAAVVHDYLYFTGKYQRKTADMVFRYLMWKLKVAPWKRRVMYLAVRWFGGLAWNKFRRGQRPNTVGHSPKVAGKL